MNRKSILILSPIVLFSTLVGCGGSKTLSSISVTLKEPSIVYEPNKTISKTDFIVTAMYSDKSTENINDFTSSEFSDADTYTFKEEEIPEKTFNFSYKDKTATCKVYVDYLYNLYWDKEIDFGGEIGKTTPVDLAKQSKQIIFGRTKDYAKAVESLEYKGEAGETDKDKIICYFDDSESSEKLYILSVGRIMIDDEDTVLGEDNGMFEDCSDVTEIKLDNIDTRNVTDMLHMFAWCENLSSLDLKRFDTSNVVNMEHMFQCCKTISSIDLSGFNTSNVINMEYMFDQCYLLTSIDLSSFDTSKVEDMEAMFSECHNLTSLNIINFNTSNVNNMDFMFSGCPKLTTLDLSSFDTSNVESMYQMFVDCTNLKSLNLSSFNTIKVEDMDEMFSNCSSLTTIYSSSLFSTANVTTSNKMFLYCKQLVGGKGTKYNESYVDKTYARIDQGPSSSEPGYFTSK